MPGAPLDAEEFDRWRTAADRALAASGAQLESDLHEWSCFLAEQAAQLGVKGLLHGIGAEAWGHDLAALCERVASTLGEPWPPEASRWAERLSRFYIPTRYPDAVPGGVPGQRYVRADAEAAGDDARSLLAAVDTAWSTLTREAG